MCNSTISDGTTVHDLQGSTTHAQYDYWEHHHQTYVQYHDVGDHHHQTYVQYHDVGGHHHQTYVQYHDVGGHDVGGHDVGGQRCSRVYMKNCVNLRAV